MTLVTAIITTHNRPDLVMHAIKSVLHQTYPKLECVVVDDASEGGVNKNLENRVDITYIYIPKEESCGGNHARNVGINAAHGEYVAFLDDDDYWLPTKIEKQVALIEEKKCGVVYCGMRPLWIGKDGDVRSADWLPLEDGQGDLSQKIMSRIYLITSGMLVRRDLLEKVEGFDENLRYWQEYELSIRLLQLSEVYAVDECLYEYRIDECDKNRLTNKYDAWKESVHYIHVKHKELYRRLPIANRIDALRLCHGEACSRAKKAGLRCVAIYHKIINVILKRARWIIR